jgi:DNA/RNA endonuclease YhcR with UshA esterase domain
MNQRKLTQLFLFLTILGILLLTIITQNQGPITEGIITSLEISEKQTKIKLSDEPRELILFGNPSENLATGQKVIVYGREETYRNKQQILVDKIEVKR